MGDLFFSIFKMLGIKLTNILKKMVYHILNPFLLSGLLNPLLEKKFWVTKYTMQVLGCEQTY